MRAIALAIFMLVLIQGKTEPPIGFQAIVFLSFIFCLILGI